jgi:hypothetical protein
MKPALLAHTGAQIVLLGANLLLLVNFLRSCCGGAAEAAPTLFRPVAEEASAS